MMRVVACTVDRLDYGELAGVDAGGEKCIVRARIRNSFAQIGNPCYKLGIGGIAPGIGGRMGVRMRAKAFETFRIEPETGSEFLYLDSL